jgi:hypothetical protein
MTKKDLTLKYLLTRERITVHALLHLQHRVAPVDQVALILRMLFRMAGRLAACMLISCSCELQHDPHSGAVSHSGKPYEQAARTVISPGITCMLRLLRCLLLRLHSCLGVSLLLRILLLQLLVLLGCLILRLCLSRLRLTGTHYHCRFAASEGPRCEHIDVIWHCWVHANTLIRRCWTSTCAPLSSGAVALTLSSVRPSPLPTTPPLPALLSVTAVALVLW